MKFYWFFNRQPSILWFHGKVYTLFVELFDSETVGTLVLFGLYIWYTWNANYQSSTGTRTRTREHENEHEHEHRYAFTCNQYVYGDIMCFCDSHCFGVFFCRDYHIRWLTNQSKIKETILKHNSQGVVRDNKMLIGIAKDILISDDRFQYKNSSRFQSPALYAYVLR